MSEKQVARATRIALLIVKRMQDELTEEELEELESWLRVDGENYLLYEDLMDESSLWQGIEEMKGIDTEAALERFNNRISEVEHHLSIPFINHRRRKIKWSLAAAAIVISIGAYLFFGTGHKNIQVEAQGEVVQLKQQELETGSKKAVLRLSDGRNFNLNQLNGVVWEQK